MVESYNNRLKEKKNRIFQITLLFGNLGVLGNRGDIALGDGVPPLIEPLLSVFIFNEFFLLVELLMPGG